MKNFHELSYSLHQRSFTENDDESKKIKMSWLRQDTVDYWRHFRMIEPLRPMFNHYENLKCITVGDGRYGLDSVKLKKIAPSFNFLPTDIAPQLLKQSKEMGIIDDYSIENAEKLNFADEQFEFAFCIESYHHFPRPFIALYEMLRVSKMGVILIEPNDAVPHRIPRLLVEIFIRSFKNLVSRNKQHPEQSHFEESGNYIFSISKREIEKIAIGLQLPLIAFYPFNDHYEKGVEFELARPGSKLFARLKRKIRFKDLKCQLGLSRCDHLIAVMFKCLPTQEVIDALRTRGFEVIRLPENPYLKNHDLSTVQDRFKVKHEPSFD